MGIYIKDMEMPVDCLGCFLVDYCIGKHWALTKYDTGYKWEYIKDNCLLTEVPKPHGRLIDANKLYATVQSNESADAYVRFLLRNSPTVIEAESEALATEIEADKAPHGKGVTT